MGASDKIPVKQVFRDSRKEALRVGAQLDAFSVAATNNSYRIWLLLKRCLVVPVEGLLIIQEL